MKPRPVAIPSNVFNGALCDDMKPQFQSTFDRCQQGHTYRSKFSGFLNGGAALIQREYDIAVGYLNALGQTTRPTGEDKVYRVKSVNQLPSLADNVLARGLQAKVSR